MFCASGLLWTQTGGALPDRSEAPTPRSAPSDRTGSQALSTRPRVSLLKNFLLPLSLHHDRLATPSPLPVRLPLRRWRSEEHTSELQSLMRISYAVFCLK